MAALYLATLQDSPSTDFSARMVGGLQRYGFFLGFIRIYTVNEALREREFTAAQAVASMLANRKELGTRRTMQAVSFTQLCLATGEKNASQLD